MGSHGYRRLQRWKSVFVDAFVGLGVYGNIYVKELGQEGHEGPTRVGARPPSLWPPRGSSDFISKSLGCLLVQEKSSQRFYFVWTLFGIPSLRSSKTRKKTETGTGL